MDTTEIEVIRKYHQMHGSVTDRQAGTLLAEVERLAAALAVAQAKVDNLVAELAKAAAKPARKWWQKRAAW